MEDGGEDLARERELQWLVQWEQGMCSLDGPLELLDSGWNLAEAWMKNEWVRLGFAQQTSGYQMNPELGKKPGRFGWTDHL